MNTKQYFKWICGLAMVIIISCKEVTETKDLITEQVPPYKVELEYKATALLGEGALWNADAQELYWVDILGKQFHRFNPETKMNNSYELPLQVGTVVAHSENQAVVALENGVSYLNLNDGSLESIATITPEEEGNRLNDGKVDPNGNLWVGSMSKDGANKSGQLYKVNAQGDVQVMLKDIQISNGIVWSGDSATMFYIDTKRASVRAFDYDITTSEISNERVIIEVPESLGYPDGMAIDENDNLWVGLWNGNGIAHYNSKTGALITKIEVPAHNVTSCTFGGRDLQTLYITTASVDMTAEEKAKYPLAGSVFSVRTNVKGVKSPKFAQ